MVGTHDAGWWSQRGVTVMKGGNGDGDGDGGGGRRVFVFVFGYNVCVWLQVLFGYELCLVMSFVWLPVLVKTG
jgi:hypothetical protein